MTPNKFRDFRNKYMTSKFRTGIFFEVLSNLFNYTDKERALKNCVEYFWLNNLKGSYIEFGVYDGKTLAKVYGYAKRYKLDMNFFGLDSFEGVPILRKGDEGMEHIFNEGNLSCSLRDCENMLKRHKVDFTKIKLFKGFFKDILNDNLRKQIKEKAAMIVIDVDIYSSAVECLNFIYPYVQDGTIIVFDDYFCYKSNVNKGERKAFNDWLKKHKDITYTEFDRYGCNGKCFILHKK